MAMSRRGGLRLVVLALTLVGFAALHAFGSATADGSHCGSPPAMMVATSPHGATESSSRGHHDLALTDHDSGAYADATTTGDHSDDVTAGCLLALFAALVLIGLRLLRRFVIDTTLAQLQHASMLLRSARGPPAPLFLSLCVFRL